MVKNKKGGGRHKKMASKHAKMPTKSFKLRLPGAEGELIAHVTKLYGYGHLNVLCNDGVERLCVIRKKFKGRNKRDNQITLHSYILVGIRSYEVVMSGKKPKCDLLYVYSRDQQKQLKQGGIFIIDCNKRQMMRINSPALIIYRILSYPPMTKIIMKKIGWRKCLMIFNYLVDSQ